MIDREKVSNNLRIVNELTQNGASPPLEEYWGVIVDELSSELRETRSFLLSCDSNDIRLMGGYFEDISERFNDPAFIDLLLELQKKHPDIDMAQDIQWAKDAMS